MNEENQAQQPHENPTPTPSEPVSQTGATPADNRKIMSAIAYIGPLVIISYALAHEDPVVKFHIKQGLSLLVVWAATWVISWMIWIFAPVAFILQIAFFFLMVIGVMNAVNGKEKELPLVGRLSHLFTI
jgi:uncharacterized membrane protein